jgi:penicillin V acylase-like amidase (Ntn superfamily)
MEFEGPAPDNKKGLKWKTLFAYTGVAVFGLEHGTSDGLNEKGLAMSLLWYENDMMRYDDRQPDAKGYLNLAQHIINTFDIPQDIITDTQPDGKTVLKELTQWVTFKDLTNRNFYFRTYDNFNLRKVDLNKLDFDAKTIKRISMFDRPEAIIDVTGQTR